MRGISGTWCSLLRAAIVSVGALSTITDVAGACDACVEDKIAATYDWQVVVAAKRQGHTVVFSAIKGSVAPGNEGLRRRLVRELLAIDGVDAGSVRVSLAPPAVSFSCDLRRHRAAALLAAVNQRLRGSGARLALLRVGAPGGADPPVLVASVKARH